MDELKVGQLYKVRARFSKDGEVELQVEEDDGKKFFDPEKLQQLYDDTTPGDWHLNYNDIDYRGWVETWDEEKKQGAQITPGGEMRLGDTDGIGRDGYGWEDYRFIAEAHKVMPFLLKVYREAKALAEADPNLSETLNELLRTRVKR
jgi:hypothetical protein